MGTINMLDLAKKIFELTKSKLRITFKPRPTDDPAQRCPDITLAQKELGWRPLIDLEEGLQKTIAYFRKKSRFNQTERNPSLQPQRDICLGSSLLLQSSPREREKSV